MALNFSTWREAVLNRRDNPLFKRLQASRRRKLGSLSWTRRWLPFVVGSIPSVIFLVIAIYEWNRNHSFELSMIIKIAASLFIGISYLVWAAGGLSEAVLDILSVLGNRKQQSYRMQIDDMTSITRMSDPEIAVGVLQLLLPPLYWRVAAGAGIFWLIYLLIYTEMLTRFDDHVAVAIAIAPMLICNWALFGILGVTALMLYLLAMGCGHWHITSSIAVASALVSQGIWLIIGSALFVFTISLDGTLPGADEEKILILASLASPFVFSLLVLAGLELSRRRPGFRLLYGSIGPLTNPLLLIVVVMVSMFGRIYHDGDDFMLVVMGFVWHFGDMMSLSPPVLFMPFLLRADLGELPDLSITQILPPILILLNQLVLILLCARYAGLAIATRRQGTTDQ